jgi:AcrR family transcriptional regulator
LITSTAIGFSCLSRLISNSVIVQEHRFQATGWTVTAYEKAKSLGRERLRSLLLDTASRLLVAEGPAALTMRRIAVEVGCSTTVLYTMFGGKDGLAEGLYLEGFRRFRRHLGKLTPGADPVAHVYALSRAYRESALAEPDYYRVMFAQAIPFTPGPAALAAASTSFQTLVDGVRACIDAGAFRPGDPTEIAEVLWAAAHGVISLELSGHLSGEAAAARYALAAQAATEWFRA